MSAIKRHYHDEIEAICDASMADEELDISQMANNLDSIEDEDEFWAEMGKIEDYYYNKVAA